MEKFAISLNQLLGWSIGTSVIVACLISALWSIYFNRIKEGQKAEFQKQIETLKATKEKYNYITKIQFDAEFKIYQELSASCFQMFYCESQLFNELNNYYVNDPIDNEEERKKQQKERYINAQNAVVEFQNTLYKYAAFITEEMYERYKNFKKMNSDQVIDYSNMYIYDIVDNQKEYRKNGIKNCYQKSKDIENEFEEITKELRNYLNSLNSKEG